MRETTTSFGHTSQREALLCIASCELNIYELFIIDLG